VNISSVKLSSHDATPPSSPVRSGNQSVQVHGGPTAATQSDVKAGHRPKSKPPISSSGSSSPFRTTQDNASTVVRATSDATTSIIRDESSTSVTAKGSPAGRFSVMKIFQPSTHGQPVSPNQAHGEVDTGNIVATSERNVVEKAWSHRESS